MKLAIALSALSTAASASAYVVINFFASTDCSGSVYTQRQVYSDDNGSCHNTMIPDYTAVKSYYAMSADPDSTPVKGSQYVRIWYDHNCKVDYDTGGFVGDHQIHCYAFNNKTFQAYQSVHAQ